MSAPATPAPWNPAPGELFYAESLSGVEDASGRLRRDRSWCNAIFRLVAMDPRLVVADILHNDSDSSVPRRMTLAVGRYRLHPVSPEVAVALGLAEAAPAPSRARPGASARPRPAPKS